MFKLVSGAVAALMMTSVYAGAADTVDPHIVPHKVNDRLHVLYGGNGLGSSVGVVETVGGLVLIDAMRDKTAGQLATALNAISGKPVSYLFNTHRHEDHTSGNGAFLKNGAVLIRQASGPDGGETNQIRFDEHLSLSIDGVMFEAFAVQSHTPDDVLVYLPKENVLFMGDTFTTSWHPTFYSGGEEGQLAVIDKALALVDEGTVIVPGHGAVTDRAGIIEYRDAFGAWMARMRKLSADGVSIDQMEADAGLKAISKLFLQDGSNEEIRAKGYRRFIERTISTELMPVDESVLPHLADYVGDYRYEDGMPLRIELAGDKLKAFEGDRYTGALIPLSKTEFHFPGWLEGEGKMTFNFNGAGKVVGAAFVDAEKSYPAQKIARGDH